MRSASCARREFACYSPRAESRWYLVVPLTRASVLVRVELTNAFSLSRSYDSVLTAHRSRLHRRATRRRQKGIFIIHPGAVFLSNALANTYEYLLGKT